MTVFSVYIINKAGGLIYHQDFSANAPRLSANARIVLASTFHGWVPYGRGPVHGCPAVRRH